MSVIEIRSIGNLVSSAPPEPRDRQLGPVIRKLLRQAKRVTQSNVDVVVSPSDTPRRAVRALLFRTANELAQLARNRTLGSAYDDFHRVADSPLAFPATEAAQEPFAEVLIRAGHRGELIEALVVGATALLLGVDEPSPELRREVRRHIGRFEALAFEGMTVHRS